MGPAATGSTPTGSPPGYQQLYPSVPGKEEPKKDGGQFPYHTRSGKKYQYSRAFVWNVETAPDLLLAMVEAPGVNRDTVLFQRPWTLSEIKEAMVHLPLPGEVGGNRMDTELLTFCRDFKPTTHELRCLLMTKIGPEFSRINLGWPDNDLRLSNPDWNHNNNDAIINAFSNHWRVRSGLCRFSFEIGHDENQWM